MLPDRGEVSVGELARTVAACQGIRAYPPDMPWWTGQIRATIEALISHGGDGLALENNPIVKQMETKL
jgi:hypothetical protein